MNGLYFRIFRCPSNIYLVMDDFTVHKVGRCVDAIKNFGADVDYVLTGYTSRLKVVLDVGVKKPFKNYMRG